ncbi:MAG: hypothetical protein Q9217_006016 [Psora testacea]
MRQFELKRKDSNWLVVFDNTDYLDDLPRFFARSPSGSVIVTSRDPLARGEGFASKEVRLECFDKTEGIDFMLSFLDPTLCQEMCEKQSLDRLVDIFAGLPLGLTVATRIMRSKYYSPTTFLKIFRQAAEDIDSAKVLGTSKTLRTLWDVSLRATTKDTKELLEKLTLLDPAMIPFKMFESSEAEQSSESSLEAIRKFHNALESLSSQSLVTVDGAKQSISIHRYFQDVMFRKLIERNERYDAIMDMTLGLLRKACPPASFQSHISPEHWKVRRQYASHTEFIQKRSEHRIPTQSSHLLVDLLSDTVFTLIKDFPSYYYETGQYDQAIAAKDKLETVIKSNAIQANPMTLALLYFTYGNMCNECNETKNGIASFRKAIDLLEPENGGSSQRKIGQNLAAIYSSLGNSLNGLERFEESEKCHHKAIELILRINDPPTKSLGRLYSNLGSCLLWKGELNEAESVLLTSLLKYDRKLGCSLYALGNVYLAQGKMGKGLDLHIETLEVFSADFGIFHPNTADSLYKVGSLYARTDNPKHSLAEAE